MDASGSFRRNTKSKNIDILAFGSRCSIMFLFNNGFFSKPDIELNIKIKKSYNRILSVWGQTFFYSVVVGIVLHLIYKTSVIAVFKSFFSIYTE